MSIVTRAWIITFGRLVPTLLLPGCLTYFGLSRFTQAPAIVILFATFWALPAIVVLNNILESILIRRRAYMNGAQVPPMFFDPSFFGVSFIRAMMKEQNGHTGQIAKEICKQYGHTFNFRRPGGTEATLTTEPEHVKALLATQFDNFVLGDMRYYIFYPFLGDGVFNSDGEIWKIHRSATRPYFSKDKISHLENFDLHAEVAISLAKERLRQDVPIDIQDLAGRFTLDSATQFLLGFDIQSLDAGVPSPPHTPAYAQLLNPIKTDHPSNRFVTAFTNGLLYTGRRGVFGKYAPLFERKGNEQVKMREIIDPYIDTIITRVRQNHDKADNNDDETLLEHLIGFIDDPKFLRDEILNLLVAGRDTTAGLITFCVYALTQYPSILFRLRQEIMEHVGGIGEKPSIEVIKNMKYLRAFLNETLRLYPVVPANSRQATQDTVLKSSNPSTPDYFIPGGSRVFYHVLVMHRRKDLWGQDADIFDPDRFLDWRLSKYLTPNPFIFLPFNAGPRICLGQQFAYTEASYFLIKLLQHFEGFELTGENPAPEAADLEGRMGEEKIGVKDHLTLYVEGGLWVKMKECTDLGDRYDM